MKIRGKCALCLVLTGTPKCRKQFHSFCCLPPLRLPVLSRGMVCSSKSEVINKAISKAEVKAGMGTWKEAGNKH